MRPLAVPIVIFVVCLVAGVFAASQWLPGLAPGLVGGLSFFVVCGILGAALAVFGLRIYDIVESLESSSGALQRLVVTTSLEQILWECGLLLGVAAAVYLLAPAAEDGSDDTPRPG